MSRRTETRTTKRKRSKRAANTVGVITTMAPTALRLVHPDPLKAKTLKAFLRLGTVAGACNSARIGRSTFYGWAREDPLFFELFQTAEEDVTDRIEEATIKRAVDGSDTLAIFLLKTRRRAKYAERVQLTEFSPELQVKVQQTLALIASRASWDSQELIDKLSSDVWTDQ